VKVSPPGELEPLQASSYKVKIWGEGEKIMQNQGITREEFDQFQKRVDDNFSAVNKRIDDLRNDLDHLRDDMNQRFKTLTWVITGWFSFLALLIVVFKFLRF